MEALKVMQRRASLKSCLSDREINKGDLIQILEAARAAPSGRNNQPTRFVVVDDKAIIQRLAAESFSRGNAIAGEAPVLIFICANPKDSTDRGGESHFQFDAGLATENLLLAATDLGLATNIMTGFKEAEAKKILGIPEEVRVIAATPLACPKPSSYDEAAKGRLAERTRKSLAEIAFRNSWGNPVG
ncbi:MAG: nitroreductase family protein [Chloroflexi bacterium]|nr:nitroreductase family protein [Chloroflexota bacterium]